jgi:hypothetical protein
MFATKEGGIVMTRVADDELGRFARQQNDLFQRVRNGGLPIEKAFRMHRQLLGNLSIPVDPARAWDDMVKAGNYKDVYISSDFNPAVNLPVVIPAAGLIEVNLRKQPETTTSGQWLDILDKNESSVDGFTHPFAVLGIGEHEPEEQTEAPVFTLWFDASGKLWCLILYVRDERRYLHLDRDYLGFRWIASCRAAASAKLPVQPSAT